MSVPEGNATFLVVTNKVTDSADVQELSEQTLPGIYLGSTNRWGVEHLLRQLSDLGLRVLGAYTPLEAAQYGGHNYLGGRLIVVDSGDDDPWKLLATTYAALRDKVTLWDLTIIKE